VEPGGYCGRPAARARAHLNPLSSLHSRTFPSLCLKAKAEMPKWYLAVVAGRVLRTLGRVSNHTTLLFPLCLENFGYAVAGQGGEAEVVPGGHCWRGAAHDGPRLQPRRRLSGLPDERAAAADAHLADALSGGAGAGRCNLVTPLLLSSMPFPFRHPSWAVAERLLLPTHIPLSRFRRRWYWVVRHCFMCDIHIRFPLCLLYEMSPRIVLVCSTTVEQRKANPRPVCMPPLLLSSYLRHVSPTSLPSGTRSGSETEPLALCCRALHRDTRLCPGKTLGQANCTTWMSSLAR